MAYVKKSIGRPAGGAGNPSPKSPNIILIDVDDIATFPTRELGVTTVTEGLELKEGAKAISFYFTPSSIELIQEAEGDADARGYKKGVKGEHPGVGVNSEDFIEDGTNRGFVALVKTCDGGTCKLIGDPCNPLSMKVETTDTKDGAKKTITLQQDVRDQYRIVTYTGELPAVESAIVAPEGI